MSNQYLRIKKIIKRIMRLVFTFPQIIITALKGIRIKNFDEYESYSTFFRYFPFAIISKEKIVTFFLDGKKVKMFCGKSHPRVLAGTFSMKDYDMLPNIKGKDILDIGAAIGDTAVYFGLKGARKIYSYEINKRYFEVCKKNIELNNLGSVVEVQLCGIGNDSKPLDGSLSILGAILPKEDREEARGVRMKTLNEITKEHGIKNGILKIDVDGFEYAIMEGANCDTLNNFSHIIIEYHFGVKNLANQLKSCGFKIDVKKVAEVFADSHPEEFQHMDIGYIYAVRV
jgi:FkbM family methyltransferase